MKIWKVYHKNIKKYYEYCTDIKQFAEKMYSLWKVLPTAIQHKQPFYMLSYADDPLSWGDIEQKPFYL